MRIELGTDLANVEEGFPIAPAGQYAAVVIKSVQRKKKNATAADFPYLAWECVIGFEKDGRVTPVHLVHITSLSPKALGMLKGWLVATKAIGGKDSVSSFNDEDVIGRRVKVTLSVVPISGKAGNRNNIESYAKLEDGSPLTAMLDKLSEGALTPTMLAEVEFP